MRKVPVGDAVGMTICHDITRIIPGEKKSREFRRGDVITPGDINRLRLLGKESVYVWEPDSEHIHEDEAALRLARHAAGPGLAWSEPNQGKVVLIAQHDGLFKVQVDRLNMINRIGDLAIATLHNNRVVKKGEVVAGVKAIPLTVHRSKLDEAEKICCRPPEHLLSVKPFLSLWTGVVITGTEVYSGRIQDGFGSLLRRKTAPFGARMMGQVIVPDSVEVIAEEIRYLVSDGAELILVTGGMSVDPDDVTPMAIRATGAEVVFYGAPVLPGSMFMLAYRGHVPVCGVPAGALFHKVTILDLILPRIFAGERIEREDIILMGHGGLCQDCPVCHYPNCTFGKTTSV
ncbi:MAG: molybdopterin-binding protein [Syntrophomonadaceae bacterium]|nr:molybdopterin-binding protein [Syntrophomonadaceae bacterium]